MIKKKTDKDLQMEIEDFLPIIETCPRCHERTLIESASDIFVPPYSIYPHVWCAHCSKSFTTTLDRFLMGFSYVYTDALPNVSAWRAFTTWLKIKLHLIPLIAIDEASVENRSRKNFRYKRLEELVPEEKERWGSSRGRDERYYIW